MTIYYYAYLDENDICTEIYAMPAQITGSQFISLPSNDTSVVGKHYNRTASEFETVYYYAVLNDKYVVTEVDYSLTQQSTTDKYRAITFAQYQTVKGLYWNGTDYVTPPISIAAIASTDEVSYKDEEKWLSTKLDEMEANISANEADISTVGTNVSTLSSTVTSVSSTVASLSSAMAEKADTVHTHGIPDVTGLAGSLADITGDVSEIATGLAGKANVSHTHTAADISGVVKTVNGNVPDEAGNIVVTSGGMTADEILEAVKTVDGAGSGLDADTLDGIEASGFAAADHEHTNYATNVAVSEAIAGLADNIDDIETALAGKADTTHNHDSSYALIGHTHSDYATVADVATALSGKANATHSHTMENVTGLVTALAGKSSTEHNHNTAYAPISHSHVIDNVTGLTTALASKADSTHNHDTVYADINHTHDEYATTESVSALETTVSGLENNIAGKAEVSHSHSQNDVTGLSAALNGKANTSHTHAQGDITGLTEALNGKAPASHTHSNYLSTSGGTVNGNVNVNGLVRVNNQQCLFDSGSMITLSTNNRETMIAGSKIYSKVAISTSSDARLKENVQPAPVDDLIEMVKGLEIKKFNYIGNNEKNIGVIAQDFMYNNPTYMSELFIRQCCDDGMYSFKDTELVYALVAAIQDIYNRLDNNN